MLRPGTCRWCRCSHFNPCPDGCGWADPEQTLCTECVAIEHAWRALPPPRLPNMVRAFFRGFVVGADDARRCLMPAGNPYATSQSSRYWERGRVAGEQVKGEGHGRGTHVRPRR
jgi:hypothetical protein